MILNLLFNVNFLPLSNPIQRRANLTVIAPNLIIWCPRPQLVLLGKCLRIFITTKSYVLEIFTGVMTIDHGKKNRGQTWIESGAKLLKGRYTGEHINRGVDTQGRKYTAA